MRTGRLAIPGLTDTVRGGRRERERENERVRKNLQIWSKKERDKLREGGVFSQWSNEAPQKREKGGAGL